MNRPPSVLLAWATLALLAATAQAAPSKPTISWSPCYRDVCPCECGTLQVPLDYDHPTGATISIAVLREPARDPTHRIGSLFLNPGGPGGSGFEFALYAGQVLYSSEIRNRFDIVGFDPRGIESSDPLRCFGNPRQWIPYFTPFPFPITADEQAAWETSDRYLDGQCDQRASRIMDHMSTAEVARDLDLLRQAVGDDQLTYAGYSYGSYLGVTYANLFPDKVRAMILDGVLDPIAWSTGVPGDGPAVPITTRIHSAAGAQATLDEFFRLCDAGGSNCSFGPGASSRFAALANKLKGSPVPVLLPNGATIQFTYPLLIAYTLGTMYDSFAWWPFADFLAALEAAAPPAALGTRLDGLWRSLGFMSKRGFPQYQNDVEGFPGVICADSDNPDSYAAWSAASAAEEARFGYFGPIWTWNSSICAAWPGGQTDRYVGPFTARTAHPVLLMNTLYDPATRYEGAQTVASLLPNSRLLTVAGWGHTTLFLSAQATEAAIRYLVDGTLPPPGTVFTQDFVPFGAPPGLVAKSAAATGKALLTPVLVPDFVRRLPKGKDASGEAIGASSSPATGAQASPDPAAEQTEGAGPKGFELMPNYPNPFGPTTTIRFAVPEKSHVRLSVYTLLGQEVARLVDGEVGPGLRSIQWKAVDRNGRALPPGVYVYRMRATSLTTGEFHQVGKMILTR